MGKDISDNNYGEASTIDKNVENEYYLVKWTGGSYSQQYFHKMGGYFIKAGELMFETVYLNKFNNFKKWYTLYGKMKEKQLLG